MRIIMIVMINREFSSSLMLCNPALHINTEKPKDRQTDIERQFDTAGQSFREGREGVKWDLGFAFFRGWEMGFCVLGLGFMKKITIEKWEWDFNLGNTGWDCGI